MNRRSFIGKTLGVLASLAGLGSLPRPAPQPPKASGWQITLRAKKIQALLIVPNELLQYAVPATDLLDDAKVREMVKNITCQEVSIL